MWRWKRRSFCSEITSKLQPFKNNLSNTYKQNLTILALREGGINFSTRRHSLPLCARTISDLHHDAALPIPVYEKPVGAVRPAEASDWGVKDEALVCKATDQADKWQKPNWSGLRRSDRMGRRGHSQHQYPRNVWILTRSLSVEDSALSGEKKTCEILDDMTPFYINPPSYFSYFSPANCFCILSGFYLLVRSL